MLAFLDQVDDAAAYADMPSRRTPAYFNIVNHAPGPCWDSHLLKHEEVRRRNGLGLGLGYPVFCLHELRSPAVK